MPNDCPLCGSSKDTRTLPAIVNEGTFTFQATGNSFGAAFTPGGVAPVAMVNRQATTGQNTLASWLAFPAFKKPGAMFGWGLGLLAFGGLIAAGATALAAIAPDPQNEMPPMWLVPFGIYAALWQLWAPGGLLAFFGLRTIRRFRAQQPWREQAWRTWHTLRYCPRDGVVYLPGTAHAFHPSLTRSFIFSDAAHTPVVESPEPDRGR